MNIGAADRFWLNSGALTNAPSIVHCRNWVPMENAVTWLLQVVSAVTLNVFRTCLTGLGTDNRPIERRLVCCFTFRKPKPIDPG